MFCVGRRRSILVRLITRHPIISAGGNNLQARFLINLNYSNKWSHDIICLPGKWKASVKTRGQRARTTNGSLEVPDRLSKEMGDGLDQLLIKPSLEVIRVQSCQPGILKMREISDFHQYFISAYRRGHKTTT